MSHALPDRLRAWNPTMAEYVADRRALSSGDLAMIADEGLATWLYRKQTELPRRCVTTPALARGIALHALVTGDTTTNVFPAPEGVAVRRGETWERIVEFAEWAGFDAIVLHDEAEKLGEALYSLSGGWAGDTAAKREIRSLVSGPEWERWPEVSHIWQPEEVPGAWLRCRQDLICRHRELSTWVAFSFKTTEISLTDRSWLRFWRNRGYRRSDAFYRDGQQDLFGDTPFVQLVGVVRLLPPYPWRIIDLTSRSDELDREWWKIVEGESSEDGYTVPGLREITETLARGERTGPEEKGLF